MVHPPTIHSPTHPIIQEVRFYTEVNSIHKIVPTQVSTLQLRAFLTFLNKELCSLFLIEQIAVRKYCFHQKKKKKNADNNEMNKKDGTISRRPISRLTSFNTNSMRVFKVTPLRQFLCFPFRSFRSLMHVWHKHAFSFSFPVKQQTDSMHAVS